MKQEVCISPFIIKLAAKWKIKFEQTTHFKEWYWKCPPSAFKRPHCVLQPQVDSPLLQPLAVAYSENLFRNISCKKELIIAIYIFYLLKMDEYREMAD